MTHNIHKKCFIFLAILCTLIIYTKPALNGEDFHISSEVFQAVEKKYGKLSTNRLHSWEELISQDKNTSDIQKLYKVNEFFNKMGFVNDWDLWGVKDYWATPIEFIIRNSGDCEDFAIAKYFTLKAMGINENKLNITYVKALKYNMHHVVLTYYKQTGAEPIILDNLVNTIDPASKRTDLIPIFTFNGTGLWLAHQRGQGKLAGASSRITPWQDLLNRMSKNNF